MKKTAEDWEKIFYPALVIHNHHGFGSGYLKGPDTDFYEKKITLKEFEQKLIHCSLRRCPKDLRKLLHEQQDGEK